MSDAHDDHETHEVPQGDLHHVLQHWGSAESAEASSAEKPWHELAALGETTAAENAEVAAISHAQEELTSHLSALDALLSQSRGVGHSPDTAATPSESVTPQPPQSSGADYLAALVSGDHAPEASQQDHDAPLHADSTASGSAPASQGSLAQEAAKQTEDRREGKITKQQYEDDADGYLAKEAELSNSVQTAVRIEGQGNIALH